MSAAAMPLGHASAASSGEVTMYRLYNPNSGEHLYTKEILERDVLSETDWNYEGIGWIAPETSNTPVYRLYNIYTGDHHYTMYEEERDLLLGSGGWNDEGIGWYSDDNKAIPLYRELNPNAVTGTHNYTTDKDEHDALITAGWTDEGIGWYGVSTNVLNSISLSEASIALKIGNTKAIKVIYNPINYVGDKNVIWTSSDTSVATVSNEGVVTAIAEGEAMITASVNEKSESCAVYVKAKTGLDIVKEYVTTNGKRGTDLYICSLNLGGHDLAISWTDNDYLMFIDLYDLDDLRINTGIAIDGNTCQPYSNVKFDYYTYQLSLGAELDNTYNAVKDILYFQFYSGDKDAFYAIDYETVNNAANSALRTSFPLWNDMLLKMGTNMKDVAFPNYSGF
jgi:Bacterial surface proteins containing Ig-like domains